VIHDGIGLPDLNGAAHSGTTDGRSAGHTELEFTLAEACRILAHAGLAEDILGHVSARTPGGDTILVRSRSPHERGLLFTTPADIHEVAAGADPLPHGYRRPNEFPIHSQVLAARPDVNAVVHVHPPAVVACELAGLALRPIVGAYNIPAMRMASDGFPVYPQSLLINTDELGGSVARTLGERPVCILRGHGIVTVGDTVEQAVIRALNIEILARMTLDATHRGTPPPEVPAEDIAAMPDLGSTFNDTYVWQYHRSRLELAGLDLPR
jgi:ribulose-5-phosphate 4-epimerase/fuculose-1-phosphate aldolase